MASERVLHLTDANFDQTVNSDTLTLVDFWAEWCGPCRALAPTIDQLAETYQGKLQVTKLDVDHHQAPAARFGIRGIPTVMLFKNGEPVDTFTGNNPQKIEEMIQRHLN